MSWSRTTAVTALVQILQTAAGETVTVLSKPPQTLNPPAIVVHRPTEVRYSAFSLSIDEATLPVICVGAADGEEQVDSLITLVRTAVGANKMLGGAVSSCTASVERNWRNVLIGGIDVLEAEVTLLIEM
jgi:hypothetical protein